ncbi:carbohydrate ABC transporter permease [Enterococcus italicus]|uniref:carbohydrate ABC transporter permease n=1 Tax=Enterococcus italicus TaxID=246144 RepID=UPI003F44F3BE
MKKLKSKRKKNTAFDYVNMFLILLFSIIILYPFWNQIVVSFTAADASSSLGISLWPKKWSLDAYKYIFSYGNVGLAYWNTIVRTILGTLITVAVTVLAAYPLSRKDLPFKGLFMALFVIAMFVSGGMIPTYLLIKNIGLINTRWALILPGVLNIMYVIITRNFFTNISPEIEESATMDGASPFQVLMKIVLPLSKPIVVTVALWTAVGLWNEWFAAQIYVQDKSLQVLQTLVRSMIMDVDCTNLQAQVSGVGIQSSELLLANVRAATVMVSIGPIILVYPFAQKYFIQGLQLGAVKG